MRKKEFCCDQGHYIHMCVYLGIWGCVLYMGAYYTRVNTVDIYLIQESVISMHHAS